jgi:hypothetical protein
MKTLLKTFLIVLIAGAVGILLSSLLLHSNLLTHTLHNSWAWTLARCSVYALIIIFKPQIVTLLATRAQVELDTMKAIFPNRLKLIIFFSLFELLIIQGGFAFLIESILGVIS